MNSRELTRALRRFNLADKERAWDLLLCELDKALKDPKQNKKLVAALTHVVVTAAWEAVEQGGVVGGVSDTVRKTGSNRKR